MLKGLPHALHAQQHLAAARADGGEARWHMPSLAAPVSLMLAVYPADGAYYARHLDNDAADARYVCASRFPLAERRATAFPNGPLVHRVPGLVTERRSACAKRYRPPQSACSRIGQPCGVHERVRTQ
jgi:hypothetical protein